MEFKLKILILIIDNNLHCNQVINEGIKTLNSNIYKLFSVMVIITRNTSLHNYGIFIYLNDV